ncbi:MAG: hypothetical protein K2G45_06365 [Lachnospiraceae bacterium]|nr:hypothetical protein [Lachnospiraceae bacterium]
MNFKRYFTVILCGVLALSFYPLYMGVRVVSDVIRYGMVAPENYPKYIIPYTPIALAVIMSVILMPVIIKHAKRTAVWIASALSISVFFIAEHLLESNVIVGDGTVKLEDWQMFMCYVPPDWFEERVWTAVDVLMGEYSPTFKIHFYLISIILIITILNSIYGFAQMILSGERGRKKALIIQSVCAGLFLGLCILACFTAFFRDGSLTVSTLSAILMSLFFVLFGVTSGVFAGSFCVGKKKIYSVIIPSIVASLVTLAMYIGEMFLLSGNLYHLGTGIFFESIPGIVLAPIDIVIILLSGGINALLCSLLSSCKNE